MRRVRGHRVVAGSTVLVLGLVLGDATLDARARAGWAALSGVPGVVAPLDSPLEELWRADPALRPDLGEAGGILVGVEGTRGAADVVGLDPRTGAEVWRTAVREARPGDGGAGVHCVVPDPAGAAGAGIAGPNARRGVEASTHGNPGADGVAVPYVVCVVDHAVRRPTDAPPVDPDAPPEDRLLTLDARTGAVLADRTVERRTVLSALAGDVVTGYADDGGHVHVTRTDPLGEHVRWSFVTPHPLPRSHLAWVTRIAVDTGVVRVDEAAGWVLSADGEVLHSWTASGLEELARTTQVVGGGRFLVRPQSTGGPWPRVTVTDLRNGRSYPVTGRAVPVWPDDGSVDDRLLVEAGGQGRLVTRDASGRTVWTAPGNVQGRAALIDGRLYRVGTGDLAALDARTGAVLWSAPLTRTARTSLVTDGRLAVVTRLDPEAGVVLTAYGLDDGRPRWTADVADDIGTLVAFGDRLFGWTGQQLVALGSRSG